MLFWLVVARLENVDDVGAAQALFQAMTFITFITNMGLPVAMAHYTSPSTVNLANWMLTARAALAVGSCIVFLVVAGWAEVFAPLWQWGWLAGSATFVILGVGFAAAVLIEMRLVTLRRWRLVVGRSAVAALARLVLVIPLALAIIDDNLEISRF